MKADSQSLEAACAELRMLQSMMRMVEDKLQGVVQVFRAGCFDDGAVSERIMTQLYQHSKDISNKEYSIRRLEEVLDSIHHQYEQCEQQVKGMVQNSSGSSLGGIAYRVDFIKAAFLTTTPAIKEMKAIDDYIRPLIRG